MDISNPQFRESIITMDGEIVRPRVRTIAQMAALTPRANVIAFKDDSVAEYYMPRMMIEDGGGLVRIKVIDIGVWNLVANATVDVAHGLTAANIISVTGYFTNDAVDTYRPIPGHTNYETAQLEYCISQWDATNITIRRLTGSSVDNALYNDGVMNRGMLFVAHIEP